MTTKRLPTKRHLMVSPHKGNMLRAIALATEFAPKIRHAYPSLNTYQLWALMEDCLYLKDEIEEKNGSFLLGPYRTAFLIELSRLYFAPQDEAQPYGQVR